VIQREPNDGQSRQNDSTLDFVYGTRPGPSAACLLPPDVRMESLQSGAHGARFAKGSRCMRTLLGRCAESIITGVSHEPEPPDKQPPRPAVSSL
jgi:hypothetical protein